MCSSLDRSLSRLAAAMTRRAALASRAIAGIAAVAVLTGALGCRASGDQDPRVRTTEPGTTEPGTTAVVAPLAEEESEHSQPSRTEAFGAQRVAGGDLSLSFALAYPNTSPLLRSAQEAVEADPTVENRVALAFAFLQRLRETHEPHYAALAGDALGADEPDIDANPRWWLARGMLSMDAHDFEAAFTIADDLVSVSPENARYHMLRGDALLELRRIDEAISAHQTALDLQPGLRTYNRAAHLRWILGDTEGALEMLDLALGSGSRDDPEALAWCLADRARISATAGDSSGAHRDARAALALVPSYPPAEEVLRKLGTDLDASTSVADARSGSGARVPAPSPH